MVRDRTISTTSALPAQLWARAQSHAENIWTAAGRLAATDETVAAQLAGVHAQFRPPEPTELAAVLA